MCSKYLFLAGSQFSQQEIEKLSTLEQANLMELEDINLQQNKSQHEADSHICIHGKIFICLEAILGRGNCQFCVVNTFNKLVYSRIDQHQNLHLSFKSNGKSLQTQNMNSLMQSLSSHQNAQSQAIYNMIEQLMSTNQTKQSKDEESSYLSMSTNTSIPKSSNSQNKNSPFLSISWQSNESHAQFSQIEISSQFLQILDWSVEELQLQIHSTGLPEFNTGFNLNEPTLWILEQFCQNNVFDQNYSCQSPLFAQKYLNSKKQTIDTLVQYEITNTSERFQLDIIIKQVESTLGRRYPTRQAKESGKINVQLQTQQSISMFFDQSFIQKPENLVTQQNRILSTEEIQFIEKYFVPNLQQQFPQLVKYNQKQCEYRQI